MTFFAIDPYGTTTLACLTSVADELTDNKDAVSTTILGLSTSVSTAQAPNHIYMGSTRYVESLSDDQLVRYVEMIEQREDELNNKIEESGVKTFTKTRI